MSDSRDSNLLSAQTAWRRWEMGELKAPRQAPASRQAGTEAGQREAFQHQTELKALRERVIREARETGHQEGYAAGHAEGLAKGLEEGLEEGRRQAKTELETRAQELLSPLASLAETFSQALKDLDETIAEDLVELSLETGRQLAGEALKTRPHQVLELVRTLLHTEPPLVGQQRLWLHPLDARLVEKHLGEQLAAAGWTLQPDEQLRRGGCRVTSANGELDATWETRWEAVKAQVRRRQRPGRQNTSEQNSSEQDSKEEPTE